MKCVYKIFSDILASVDDSLHGQSAKISQRVEKQFLMGYSSSIETEGEEGFTESGGKERMDKEVEEGVEGAWMIGGGEKEKEW